MSSEAAGQKRGDRPQASFEVALPDSDPSQAIDKLFQSYRLS